MIKTYFGQKLLRRRCQYQTLHCSTNQPNQHTTQHHLAYTQHYAHRNSHIPGYTIRNNWFFVWTEDIFGKSKKPRKN